MCSVMCLTIFVSHPVALNFQTPCAEMDLNQGLFSQNGQSGYVLKPAYLRDTASEFDPITLIRGPWLRHVEFHVMVSTLIPLYTYIILWWIFCNDLFLDYVWEICAPIWKAFRVFILPLLVHQVISAQQLPKASKKSSSIVDPLVRVEIHGVPADTSKRQTQHVNNNGTRDANA